MAVARTHSIALVGVSGHPVEIEADIQNGLPGLLLVGLPDTALREARDRIRAAIINSGERWPQRRITVGLSPASLPKRGSGFDAGIAVAILSAAGVVPASSIGDVAFLGELGLDGQLRPVRGVLPAVLAAAAAGFRRVAVPEMNAAEASLVPDVSVFSAPTLSGLLRWLRGEDPPAPPQAQSLATPPGPVQVAASGGPAPDLADVLGQAAARRAAEICAAGGHHMCLLGPPGAGKTMLAERIPTVLPPLGIAEALEVTAIHSVAGVLADGSPLMTRPPFCAPHHTASKAAIVGGGSGVIRPGAASLAHRGCLFLDEAPEFGRDVLDALRQPLESGQVVVARSGVTARFPARFTLVLAANPCPCARASGTGGSCSCTPAVRRRYLARLSGPLLDRVDVKVEFLPVSRAELLSDRKFAEPSAVVAERVQAARRRAAHRLRGTPWRLNAEIPGRELTASYAPVSGALAPLERAMDRGQISARGVHRVMRVAWTLADLAGIARPTADQTSYALGLWLGAAS
ncbi:MAG TPA: YifB family Mg chelatase-like AAA ATPase [Streptosporangiaceae bacterium]|jgi:magnesium chelatase family protein|nr:YifB family Mg chelatase-like AAA ATPase [Streptosporangiaceae bacterium]